jgi:hypothetical protein
MMRAPLAGLDHVLRQQPSEKPITAAVTRPVRADGGRAAVAGKSRAFHQATDCQDRIGGDCDPEPILRNEVDRRKMADQGQYCERQRNKEKGESRCTEIHGSPPVRGCNGSAAPPLRPPSGPTANQFRFLLAAQGRPENARALLQPVYDQYVEGFDTADLKAAERLLATLG